jgi:5-formaminoimidazole-4-carboxamide-1-(beta)-D-ribofuranosyl 5'-monophosphate synthetase
MNQNLLEGYDLKNLTIGVLGGHSALDVCEGAKRLGFKTLAVCQKGREQTYEKYYKSRGEGENQKGCIDEILLVDKFSDITKPEVQEQLRERNTIFIHNRYFWVYCNFEEIENDFNVPIYGLRQGVKLEERDQPLNQYHLLEKAGIRTPKIVKSGTDNFQSDEDFKKILDAHFSSAGTPLLIKVNEATRTYERAFFVCTNTENFFTEAASKVENGEITQEALNQSTIEEFIIGAQVNFNYFYSSLNGELELMGTDTRRQTSLDGFLRLDAKVQNELLENGYKPSMIETGHIACTTKESIIEKAFEAGEKFVKTLKKEVAPGMIGPFALQGAIATTKGKEEIVIFDVSMRIPGSPGTRYTPYTSYLWGRDLSYGERIAIEIREALDENRLQEIIT